MNQLKHRELKDILGGSLESSGRNSRLTHNRLFPGPACCCDVAYLYQAFSQPTGPGRLWISLGAILLSDPSSQMTESNHELKQLPVLPMS
jgi:hypothetical protein